MTHTTDRRVQDQFHRVQRVDNRARRLNKHQLPRFLISRLRPCRSRKRGKLKVCNQRGKTALVTTVIIAAASWRARPMKWKTKRNPLTKLSTQFSCTPLLRLKNQIRLDVDTIVCLYRMLRRAISGSRSTLDSTYRRYRSFWLPMFPQKRLLFHQMYWVVECLYLQKKLQVSILCLPN